MRELTDDPPSTAGAGPSFDAKGFRADIQGIRALAILLVVAFHVGIAGFDGGFIGVDVFFTLSGYLISGLIIREVESEGRLQLVRFYSRRFRRLLPVSALVLVVTLAASALVYSPLELGTISESAQAMAVYMSNLLFAVRTTDYFGGDLGADPYLHTWSLAVEEQFYLVWPLLLVALLKLGARWRARSRVLGSGIALVALASFGLCVVLTDARENWAFFASPPRFWEFAIGALAAMAPTYWIRSPVRANALRWIGVGLIAFGTLRFDELTAFPGYAALAPALGTTFLLMAGATSTDRVIAPVLASRPAQWLGAHSYSWYLWHWPLVIFAGVLWPEGGVPSRLAAVAIALVLAMGSYRFVEQPVRDGRVVPARPRTSLVLGLGTSVVLLVFALQVNQWSQARTQEDDQRAIAAAADDRLLRGPCVTGEYAIEPAEQCRYGAEGADEQVVLIGDSHAGHWTPALDAAAKARDLEVVPIIKGYCPLVDVDFYLFRLGREYRECGQWREAAFETLEAMRPQAVVVSQFSDFYVDRDGGTSQAQITVDEWEAGFVRTAQRLDQIGVPYLFISDVPIPGFDVPKCLSREIGAPIFLGDCQMELSDSVNHEAIDVEHRVLGDSERGHRVDFASAICPEESCELVRDGYVTYIDANHISARLATDLADQLGARLDDALGESVSP